MKSHVLRSTRAQRIATFLLVLLTLAMLAGCRQRAKNDDAESEAATAAATVTTASPASTPMPTIAPTAALVAEEADEAVDITERAAAANEESSEAPDEVTVALDESIEVTASNTSTVTSAITNSVPQAVTNPAAANEDDVEQPATDESADTTGATDDTIDGENTATIEPTHTVTMTEAAAAPIIAAASGRPLDETTNILVLGSDRRPNTPNWRTDVIMVVALDTENGRAGVISIPRDVYVNRPPNGYNSNKINTMDYFGEANHPGGGPELLSTIIEEKMGVPIHHFVRFNFATFQEVVDALDGVEVEFECAFYGDLGGRSKNKKLQLEPGVHRLDGDQAIIYVRSRAVGGDLDRAERQQRFVWSIREQALSENLLPKLPALYSALSGSVQTDIGLLDAVKLARFAVNLDPTDVHAFVVAPPDMLSYGRSRRMTYFYPHWDVIAQKAQQIFETEEFVETNEIVNSKGRECVQVE